VRGDWADATTVRWRRRLGLRVRERPLPGRRRHRGRLLALARARHRRRGGGRRGLDWMVGMQSRSGGWGAFDVDNEAFWLYKLPISDFGKVTDEPSADCHAHALEALGHEDGYARVRAAGSTGSLARRKGTARGRALGREPRLRNRRGAAGARGVRLASDHPAVQRASRVARLGPGRRRRLRRGHSFLRESAWRGRGTPTASQTAWALLAYVCRRCCRALSGRRAAGIFARLSAWTATGRSSTSRALASPRFHDSLPPLPAHVPVLALGRLRERLNA
jgi:hypothetical protein